MNVNIDELIKKDAFKSIDPEILDKIKGFAERINGKSMGEIIPAFIQFAQSLKLERPVTQPEKDAMLAAIAEALPESDRNKFLGIVKML